MVLTVSWPNATHFLLQNPTVTLDVDGTLAVATMHTGGAVLVVPEGSASPPSAKLIVKFAPTFTGSATETLRVVQHFALMPPQLFGGGGPLPTGFTVRPTGSASDVTLVGRHPLLSQISALGLWRVTINTNIVDVTPVQPLLFAALNILARPTPHANVRVLARTDGKLPLHWVTATPPSCTSFADTDVLCFLTPPQRSEQDRDDTGLLVDPAAFGKLGARLAIFMAGGRHNDALPAAGRDHFARANNPTDSDPLVRNKPIPNVVLARGWEAALMSSGRHVVMALPVPSSSSHNAAATAELPTLLSNVHATLVAAGDIAAPNGAIVNGRPLLGIAAHSNGATALFSAVAASPSAFKEIWLFDTNETARNLPTLARASAANVLFAGFDAGRVVAAHATASGMPSLRGRIRRLPDPAPPNAATPAALAASSSSLTHALEGGGVASPASSWTPGVVALSSGETFVERFEVLHQHIVQGNDADGSHYVTKAFTSSAFH
jgi:hypothetical protein